MDKLPIFPLDQEASDPLCWVPKESHTLSTDNPTYRAIVPLAAPFYRRDLLIELANGLVLTEGQDYYLSGNYLELPDIAVERVYGMVVITNPSLANEVLISYRTLGGQYVKAQPALLEYLVNTLTSPRYVKWSNVLEKVTDLAPDDHAHHWEDNVNTDDIAAKIDDIGKTIENKAAWPMAVEFTTTTSWPKPDEQCLHIAPTADWRIPSASFMLKKRIQFTQTSFTLACCADDIWKVFIDDVLIDADSGSTIKESTHAITPGYHIVTFKITNSASGPALTSFRIIDGENIHRSDLTWECLVVGSVVNDKYNDLAARVNTLQSTVDASQYDQHVNSTDNAHDVSFGQVGALGVSQDAVDSLHVYSKDALELAQYIYNAGITQTDLDRYVARFGENVVTKSIVLKDGVAKIVNGRFSTTIDLSNGNISFATEGGIVAIADKNRNTNNKRATMKAGANLLEIVTSLGGLNDAYLRYNGSVVLTGQNYKRYMPGFDGSSVEIHSVATDTMKPSGTGTEDSPYTLDLTLPIATATVKGITRVVNVTGSSVEDRAISEAKIDAVIGSADGKIRKSQTINNVDVSTNRTYTKRHIKLSEVDNVSDADANISTDLQDALDDLSDIGHRHDFNTIGITDSTEDNVGIAKLVNSTAIYDEDGAVITPFYGNPLTVRATAGLDDVNSKLPSDVVDVTQYGGNSYLPVPVVGAYEGSGAGLVSDAAGIFETSGDFVALRNGRDISTLGVFYSIVPMNSDWTINKYIPTTTRYQPPFLPDGVYMKYIRRGTEWVFEGVDSEDNNWIILTNGTMDANKHQGAIVPASEYMSNGNHERCYIISGKYIYRINAWINSNGYYVRAGRVLVDDVRNKDSVSIEIVHLNGTDVAGNRQVAQEKFTFASGITDGDSNPLSVCHIMTDVWTASKNIRHANQSWELAEKNGKIRVFIYGRGYFSNAVKSMNGAAWTESFVLDTANMELERDTKSGIPMKLLATTLDVGALRVSGESQAFSGASPNAATGTMYRKGCYISWWRNGPTPRLVCQKPLSNSNDYYEHLNRETKLVSSSGYVHFVGNFGSVANMGPSGLSILPDNRMLLRQDVGHSVICEYSTDANYDGWEGLGPSTNRYDIAGAVMSQMKAVPYIWDGANESWKGRCVNTSLRTGNNQIEPDDSMVGNGGITDAFHDAFISHCQGLARANLPGIEIIESRCNLVIHAVPNVPCYGAFVYLNWNEPEHLSKSARFIFVTFDVDNGELANTFSNLQAVDYQHYSGSANSITYWGNEAFRLGGQSSVVLLDDGNYWFSLGSCEMIAYVGNTTGVGWGAYWNPTTQSVLKLHKWQTMHYDASGTIYIKSLGLMEMSRHASGTAILGKPRGNNLADYDLTGSAALIALHSTQVASGWVIYFTEEATYFANNQAYQMEKASLDLSELYPTDHMMKTFYLYVQEQGVGEVPIYIVDTELYEDTGTQFYIGTCKTSATQISELNVERGTRVGEFKELTDHNANPNAHGLNLINKQTVGAGLIENKGVGHTISLISFKDVFDNWDRFSHNNTGIYPASESELNSWEYDELTDSVKCTINSSTQIGFVSPNKVGDSRFTTYVSAHADNDDDFIGVVLAFWKDPETGKEHTLTVYRYCHGNNNNSNVSIAVVYNIAQTGAKTLFQGGGRINKTWEQMGEALIDVTRRGDVWDIHCPPFDTGEGEDFSCTVDIDNYSELEIFRGPQQFGYTARSQLGSTFRNVRRPDENMDAFYSSLAPFVKLYKEGHGLTVMSGHMAGEGVLPVPVGYERHQCKYHFSLDAITDTNGGVRRFIVAHDPITGITALKCQDEHDGIWHLAYNFVCFAQKD